MEVSQTHKLPVQGILLQLAACPNPHLIERLLELIVTDGRYDHAEWETIQRYAKARVEFLRGRL